MSTSNTNFTYNEFLAFVLVFVAEMNYPLSAEELLYIKQKTGVSDMDAIKQKVDAITDAEGLDLIDEYRKKYLINAVEEEKMKTDLENLLKTNGVHSQLEKVAAHMIEKLL
jgi:hypothetical protein